MALSCFDCLIICPIFETETETETCRYRDRDRKRDTHTLLDTIHTLPLLKRVSHSKKSPVNNPAHPEKSPLSSKKSLINITHNLITCRHPTHSGKALQTTPKFLERDLNLLTRTVHTPTAITQNHTTFQKFFSPQGSAPEVIGYKQMYTYIHEELHRQRNRTSKVTVVTNVPDFSISIGCICHSNLSENIKTQTHNKTIQY